MGIIFPLEPKMNRKAKGIRGEMVAKKYYLAQSCTILECNYRFGHSEIDLIVSKDNIILIFIEVKMRSRIDYGTPETFVSEKQKERIKDAAEDYLQRINWDKDIRFDIVCVDGDNRLEIFEDAF